MQVILQQDVKGHGKKGQLVDVSDGYARNFLLPRKLAVEANANNVNTMKLQEKARLARLEEEKAQAQELARQLKGITVELAAKAGAGGRLFGAVTTKEISDALKAQHGLEISKSKLVLEDPIKSCGTYTLKAKLGHDIAGTLQVTVREG